MQKHDYIIKMPNSEGIIEVTNKSDTKINMEGLEGKELVTACAKMFSNLGWIVKEEQVVSLEAGTFRPDIVLSAGSKDCGYVEVVTSMRPEDIGKKKEEIQTIIDKCKPAIFILTNGVIFDIFYDGKYSGSNSVPPSADTFNTVRRLSAYAKALTKIYKKGE